MNIIALELCFDVVSTDEKEVVPSKLKKSAKWTDNVASKEVQHVKESSTPLKRESRKIFANGRKQRSDESEENADSKVNRKEEYKNGREKEGRENGNVNHHTTEQPSKKRKEDFSESKSEVKKPSPEKKKDNAATLSPFFKAAVSFTVNIPIWTTLALSGQLPAVRMFDIHGAENCLDGLTFIITGILESIEREEAADFIQRYDGKVTQSVSK
ncbi:replication factor C subunit 1-like [Pocillopora verrucosa]|uniref:replication factor C subunit 1-like n=1 Tax=Pocillopora verrucosa TaxID=203993 RepID=UPI00333FE9F5